MRTLQAPDDATIYYTPAGGSRGKLDDAIFRSPTIPVEGADLIFEGVGPQFSVHRDDVADLAQGDVFERDSVLYTVTSVGKDEGFMWIAYCRLS